MPQAKSALLVGCGSIGLAHLEQLSARYDMLSVVDPSPGALSKAEQVVASAGRAVQLNTHPELREALVSVDLGPNSVAVIANWGPDHFATTQLLLEAGVGTILLEKPTADSIDDARALRRLATQTGANLWVNFTRRYSGFPENIKNLSENHRLGSVQMLTVVGGARCLATMGIHFLDLAQVVFDAEPQEVVADVVAKPLNPRSPGLLYYDGVMTYTFPKGQRFSCIYSNNVGLREVATLHWRDAVGTYTTDGQFRLTRRPRAERNPEIPVTRATTATETLFEGPVNLRADGRTGLQFVHDSVVEGVSGYDGGNTTEMLLAALHASAEGRRLRLPLDDTVDTARHWRIS